MSVTREAIRGGAYQKMMEEAGTSLVRITTEEERRVSMAEMLGGEGPVADDIWVFGYGSLVWNPAFGFAEKRRAVLHGWHRRFCMWAPIARGTPEQPGLVLALDRGGTCEGMVYRIAAAEVWSELALVWAREMIVADGYMPRWTEVDTPAGPVRAISFTGDSSSAMYAGALSDQEVVHIVAQAAGNLGTCAEYMFSTVAHLEALGIPDPYLYAMREQVKQAVAASGRARGRPTAE